MKILTIFDAYEENWHDHFLLFPTKVFVYESEPSDYYQRCSKIQWIWLETVKRRLTTDLNGYPGMKRKYIYGKW